MERDRLCFFAQDHFHRRRRSRRLVGVKWHFLKGRLPVQGWRMHGVEHVGRGGGRVSRGQMQALIRTLLYRMRFLGLGYL